MNRQKIFQNFIENSHGKGRAMESDPSSSTGQVCSYFGMHGCAIGCQPGFRAKFDGRMKDENAIGHWLDDSENDDADLRSDLLEFFEITADPAAAEDDINWLGALQSLHDMTTNWDGEKLRTTKVETFCKNHDLELPTYPS